MIYITGDCHAEWARKFSVASFPEQKGMTRNDFVIVVTLVFGTIQKKKDGG